MRLFSPFIGPSNKILKLKLSRIKKGAFFGLMIGLLSGLIRMILDFVYIEPSCGEEDNRPGIVKNVSLCSFNFLFWNNFEVKNSFLWDI